MAFIEMGVDVDKARPDEAALKIDAAGRCRAARREAGDASITDLDVEAHQTFEIRRARRRAVNQAGLGARI